MTVYAICITWLAGFLLGALIKCKKSEEKPRQRFRHSKKEMQKTENEEYLNFLKYDGTYQA